jgi:AcrR family transcriptional regulator
MPKTKTKPRKLPSQERAKETVEAILSAAAKVLVKEGFEKASTNRIAEVAGVSVGSLYQYFPSKEALISVLMDRHIDSAIQILAGRINELLVAPLEVAVRELVTLMVEIHRQDPKLHRVFCEQIPRSSGLHKISEIEQQVVGAIRAWLELHEDELRVKDLDLASFIIAQSVESLTHGAVLLWPELLEKPAFIDEVTALVVRFLKDDSAALDAVRRDRVASKAR